MGIPTYFTHIVRSHRKVIREIRAGDSDLAVIHNMYMDCNSIIYDALRRIQTSGKEPTKTVAYEELLARHTAEKIHQYITDISPTGIVFLAFDGVAPCAKMNQQRSRRFKGHYDTMLRTKVSAEHGLPITQSVFSSVAITPGTRFMSTLATTINQYFASPEPFGVKQIIVSCTDEPGEGEHKIFQYIRDNAAYHASTTSVIYGLDADLIMLTLNHLRVSERIYLFRETPEFIKTVDSSLEPNKMYVLDIPVLAHALCEEFGKSAPTDAEKRDLIADYILMCFMLGNDFLPHFPGLNIRTTGHAALMSAYTTLTDTGRNKFHLTEDGNISWKNFRKLVAILANKERDAMQKDEMVRGKMSQSVMRRANSGRDRDGKPMSPVDVAMDRYLNIPVVDRVVEQYIAVSEDYWEKRYYDELLHMDSQDEMRVADLCRNYLEGMEWTFRYYTTGCVDWRWTYRTAYPPLLADLQHHIPYFDTEFIALKPPDPVSPHVQLSYVLPRHHLTLLPADKRMRLLRAHGDSYPDTAEMSWAYCRYVWEAHFHLPVLSVDELVLCVGGE